LSCRGNVLGKGADADRRRRRWRVVAAVHSSSAVKIDSADPKTDSAGLAPGSTGIHFQQKVLPQMQHDREARRLDDAMAEILRDFHTQLLRKKT
jgi:hypothetical protein